MVDIHSEEYILGQNIRKYRLRLGWSQADLSNAVDIDRADISKYDRMEQDNERLADHQRSVLCNIRDEVDALDTLLQDTRLSRRRMQGAVRIIQQMINREL